MTTVNIPTADLKPSRYGEADTFTTEHVLVSGNGRYRHGLGYVGPEGECRRVFQGPILAGPYAFAFGLSVCISAEPTLGTGYISAQNRAAGREHNVVAGDHVVLGDRTFVVGYVRNSPEWLTLTPV